MLNKIVDALKARSDLAGWTVRHLTTHGAQVYAVRDQIESQRLVDLERYKIDVLRQTSRPDGTTGVGSGDVTILPGGDIEQAIEKAVLTAGLVANPVHTIPAPAPLPRGRRAGPGRPPLRERRRPPSRGRLAPAIPGTTDPTPPASPDRVIPVTPEGHRSRPVAPFPLHNPLPVNVLRYRLGLARPMPV